MGDTESGDKAGAEVCQREEEEDDEDGIFSPIHIPGNQLKPHKNVLISKLSELSISKRSQ